MRFGYEICIAVIVAIVIGACVAAIIAGIKSWKSDRGLSVVLVMGGVLIMAIMSAPVFLTFAQSDEEQANPCVAWGPPETRYHFNGKIRVPVTVTPCIQRQNTTER